MEMLCYACTFGQIYKKAMAQIIKTLVSTNADLATAAAGMDATITALPVQAPYTPTVLNSTSFQSKDNNYNVVTMVSYIPAN